MKKPKDQPDPESGNGIEPTAPITDPLKTKTGIFGRIKPRNREELGAVLIQDIPLRLPDGLPPTLFR